MMDVGALASGTLTCLLAVLLLRAVWHKAGAFPETTGYLAGYGIVPSGREVAATRAVIVAEAVVLVALVLPATRVAGALGAAALLAGYAGAMAFALGRGRRRIDCGCGGAPQVVSAATVARNLVLAALALAVAILPAGGTGGAPGAALAVAGGLTLWCVYAVVDRLIANAGHIELAAGQS